MKTGIFYHKRTGSPVQIIARAQTKPTYQEVICYQELTKPYDYFVMEKIQFFAEYVKDFEELPLVGRRRIGKRDDLPDKMPRISKGEVMSSESELDEKKADEKREPQNQEEALEDNPDLQGVIEFFDADSYHKKVKIFEKILEGNPDGRMIDNIAVSLDLALEDGVDMIERIRSELSIRSKYEGERGERL